MTIAYTLVNIPYLPMAKTLVDSFRKQHPEIPIYICLFDDKEEIKDDFFKDYLIYDYKNLNQKEYQDMRSRYDNMSMACALKPFFAEALIKDFNPDSVIYLDADMILFNPLNLIFEKFKENYSILLTGHLYSIFKDEKEVIANREIRKYGLYNAGFLAFQNNELGNEFLQWWKRMLFETCIREDKNGIYYDQTWLDLVPIYFKSGTYIIQDLGYNVAYWNTKERKLSIENDQYFVNDSIPLVFYHFARYKNNMPQGDFFDEKKLTPNQKIVLDYQKELDANKFEQYSKQAFSKTISLAERLRISLKYRLGLLVDKL